MKYELMMIIHYYFGYSSCFWVAGQGKVVYFCPNMQSYKNFVVLLFCSSKKLMLCQ